MPRNGSRRASDAATDSVSIVTAAEFTLSPPNTQALPLANIIVGQRHRRDLGDIPGLAASMAELDIPPPCLRRGVP
jgi:hypothetical protein